MALRIIDDGQRQEKRIKGAVFVFTVAGYSECRDLREEARDPETLRIDQGRFDELLLEKHVHDWRDVIDGAGEPVPFSRALLLRMSSGVLIPLMDAILEAEREEKEQQGNSPGSSAT